MIKEVIMYTVLCDRCGKDAFKRDSECIAYFDKEYAVDVAEEDFGFEKITKPDGSEGIVCKECWTWADDEDSIVMKPPQRGGND